MNNQRFIPSVERNLYIDLAAESAANFIALGKKIQFGGQIVATNLVCTDADGFIGVRGVLGLPWRCNDDMAIFKKLTTGKTVVMGAETWASIPNGLPGRLVVVINRVKDGCQPTDAPNVRHFKPGNFGDLEELKNSIGEDFFICGGGIIYEAYGSKADMEIVNTLTLRLADHVDDQSKLIKYTPLKGYEDTVTLLPAEDTGMVYKGHYRDRETQQPIGNQFIKTVIAGVCLDLHKDLVPEDTYEYTGNPHVVRPCQLGPMFMCDMTLTFRSAN